MSGPDVNRPAQSARARLNFNRYVLDLGRGCLLLDGQEIPLRPKTFAVLEHLIENSGRLVSKDDLFSAVWPNLVVTDDALVQSIGELRRALGEDGPRLIKTVPRRGYRFEGDVSIDVPADASPAPGVPPVAFSGTSAQSPTPGIRAGALALTHKALAGLRRGHYIALAIVLLFLVAGALWTSLPLGRRLASAPRPGDQPVRNTQLAAKPAIAVLPFRSQGEEASREYFADGLTQDIINRLGRFSGLTVLSWNAVFPYKGKPAVPAEIARSLAVRYQVEGSVRQSGDRLRVIAQLVGSDGSVIWSGRFEEALADVFALQDKITTQLAGALAIRVTQVEQQRALAKPTVNLEAYDLVLRARPALQRPARASIVEARSLLRRAVQLDPNYAAAYAALAGTYHMDVSWGWAQSPAANLNRAEELARKALDIDNSEQGAHIILGRVHLFYNRFEQAKAEMDHAVAINPSDSHGLAGLGYVLMWMGQADAAIDNFELALRIDPALNAVDRFALSMAYYQKRRYAAAVQEAELNVRNSESASFSHVVLAAAHAQQGRGEEAAKAVRAAWRSDPTFDPDIFGTKFRNPADLEHLRDGLRKAGFYDADAKLPAAGK